MDYWIRALSCESAMQCGWLLKLVMGMVVLTTFYLVLRKVCVRGILLGYHLDLKKSCLPPLRVIFFICGSYFVLSLVTAELGYRTWFKGFRVYKDAIVALSFSWMIYRIQREFFLAKCAESLAHAFSKIFSVCLVLLTAIVQLRIFELDVIPLLAFGGIGAATVGFAAKDMMGSFLAGMMLAITRPFSIHDQILIPDRNVEGTIEEIGWCFTILRDKDQRPMYIPNSLFSESLVLNLSRRSGRRILEVFRLRYTDLHKIASVTQEVKAILSEELLIDKQQPILTYINNMGEYSIEMNLDVYTTVTSLKDYAFVKEKVLQKVMEIVAKHDMTVAYPISIFKENL